MHLLKNINKFTITLLIFILNGISFQIYAQSAKPANDVLGRMGGNVISTGVPFLLIAPDTRIGGMGETGVAVENDINAQHWNPAKYIYSPNNFGFSVSYSPWLAGLNVNDIYLLYLAAYGKVTDKDGLSGSLRYFSMGSMEIRNEEGDLITDYKPHEFAFDLAYERQLIPDLSMAVTGRFIFSDLSTSTTRESKPGLAGAADISLFYHKKLRANKLNFSQIAFGLNISNIGNKISYSSSMARDFLPANFRTGIAYTMKIDPYNQFIFAIDFNKLLVTTPPIYKTDENGAIVYDEVTGEPIIEKGRNPKTTTAASAVFTSWFDAPTGFVEELHEYIVNLGIEYSYNNLLFVRTGYFNESQYKGRRKYMTFGIGIKYSVFSIDAAYILPLNSRNHPLQNTLRFSISFDFNKNGNKVAKRN
ncbi:MAG: type IX secretion system outer membrane channel protein PorV [Bacteroidales bacterium]|nr:type IX secretion system outer membrane channel protein PorV [Bacteroidales bacterium]